MEVLFKIEFSGRMSQAEDVRELLACVKLPGFRSKVVKKSTHCLGIYIVLQLLPGGRILAYFLKLPLHSV